MQNTRFSTLVDVLLTRFSSWLQNPWRRLSLIIIGLLFGTFLSTVIVTSAGQTGELDVLFAAIMVAWSELTSWLVYRRMPLIQRRIFLDIVNAIKIGLSYGLVTEAFKLGS